MYPAYTYKLCGMEEWFRISDRLVAVRVPQPQNAVRFRSALTSNRNIRSLRLWHYVVSCSSGRPEVPPIHGTLKIIRTDISTQLLILWPESVIMLMIIDSRSGCSLSIILLNISGKYTYKCIQQFNDHRVCHTISKIRNHTALITITATIIITNEVLNVVIIYTQ